jgi:hypothetical protein
VKKKNNATQQPAKKITPSQRRNIKITYFVSSVITKIMLSMYASVDLENPFIKKSLKSELVKMFIKSYN